MISFIEYRNQIASLKEQEYIKIFMYNMNNPDSPECILQYLYNNNYVKLDSYEKLYPILHALNSPTDLVIIQGNIHYNYNTSSVLFNSDTHQPLFVQNIYIRFKITDNDTIYHILISPPILSTNKWIYYNNSNNQKIENFIDPIVE